MSAAQNLQPPIFDAAQQIADQQKMLRRMEPMRLVFRAIAYGLTAAFLPFWLTLAAMGFDYLFEGLAQGWMQDLNQRANPRRYGAVLLAVVTAVGGGIMLGSVRAALLGSVRAVLLSPVRAALLSLIGAAFWGWIRAA